MKLAFKRIGGFGFYEKEIPVTLSLGVLEAVAKSFKVEFYQLIDVMTNNNQDFVVELLFQGYIMACKDRYKRPKYTRNYAIVWSEYMSKSSTNELLQMMEKLFGEITKATVKSKKKEVSKQAS